jgi:aspartate kinase
MHSTVGVADRVFRALGDINVIMISQGASEINMSIVMDEADVVPAVQRLHKEFFSTIPAGDYFEPVGAS